MRYAQIDKRTNVVLNVIEIENGYVFDGSFDWASAEQYYVTIGCFYRDEKFFNEDNTTESNRIPTPEEQTQAQLYTQQREISDINLQNAVESTGTDYRLLMLELNLM